jgi:hypothetical protein
MREIKTVTHLNLGDNIYYVHLFRKIIDHYQGNIRFIHHLHERYIKELSNFIQGYEENIIFKDIMQYTIDYIIPLEMAKVPGWFLPYDKLVEYHRNDTGKKLPILLYGDNDHWTKNHPNDPGIMDSFNFDEVLLRQFIQFCEFMNVECPIKTVNDTLLDMPELLENNILSGNYDILIGNSKPMSSQWVSNTYVFDYILDRIDLSKVKVISLEPTGRSEIPSTIENGLNLIEIGNISINSKIIIGVHSSPYTTLINKYNHMNNEFVVLQNWGKFRYSNANSVNYCTEDEFVNNYKIPLNWCKI